MPVPNTFANATTSIPLSQLDANFATAITLGNTAIQLGNTVSTLNNMTLANVTINSGTVTVANVTVTGFGTFAAGSNTAPSITTAGDTNTGFFFPATDTVSITTGGVERMRVDSAGKVGIGTTSAGNQLDVVSAGSSQIRVQDGINATAHYDFGRDGTDGFFGFSGAQTTFSGYKWSVNAGSEVMRITNGGNVGIGTSSPLRTLHVVSNAAETQLLLRESDSSGPQLLMGADSAVSGSIINASSVSGSNSNLLLQTGGTERARIDSNGNVQINTTNASATGTACRFTIEDGTTYLPFGINNNAAGTGASNVALFARNGTTTGTISVTGTTTAYNTSSDYRLKHDVQPMLSGLSTIAALKPSTYKWNADNSYGEGFIAHELQAVIPQAVSGEKDAVNENGSIKPQGVDYSKIVVHLVAAIQELSAKVAALEAKQ